MRNPLARGPESPIAKVLLADDSPLMHRAVALALRKEPLELITCDNGQDALRLTLEHRPAIVLADLDMPGLTGIELCRSIRQDASLAGTKVVLICGSFDQIDEARLQSVQADGRLWKPFEAHVLIALLSALLKSPIRESLDATSGNLTDEMTKATFQAAGREATAPPIVEADSATLAPIHEAAPAPSPPSTAWPTAAPVVATPKAPERPAPQFVPPPPSVDEATMPPLPTAARPTPPVPTFSVRPNPSPEATAAPLPPRISEEATATPASVPGLTNWSFNPPAELPEPSQPAAAPADIWSMDFSPAGGDAPAPSSFREPDEVAPNLDLERPDDPEPQIYRRSDFERNREERKPEEAWLADPDLSSYRGEDSGVPSPPAEASFPPTSPFDASVTASPSPAASSLREHEVPAGSSISEERVRNLIREELDAALRGWFQDRLQAKLSEVLAEIERD